MPTDIKLTTDYGTQFTDRGDFSTVSGEKYEIQRAVIQAESLAREFRGSQMIPSKRRQFVDRLDTLISTDEQLDFNPSVQILNTVGSTITVGVQVGVETFDIEL